MDCGWCIKNYDLTMFKMFLLVLSLLGLCRISVGQLIQFGQCNENIDLDANFNYENILGNWHELRTTEMLSGECSHYQFNEDNTVVRNSVNENFEDTLTGIVEVENNTAKMTVNWSSSSGSQDFWVLLNNNAIQSLVTYKCVNISPSQRSVSLWIMSRSETISTIGWSFINTTLINNLDINIDDLREVSRSATACYVLPTIEPGKPIILPGQCNEDISVVQEFNVAAFTGLWHEVASYYSENSENRCTRAQYTANGDVVEVINSQVINESLAIIEGTATVASTDGSARLSVSLFVNGETVQQNLLVLATDYSSYAVSYTCINLPDDTMRVFSWILSRNRLLSESAQAAVNQVIASEITLNNKYFTQSDQSNEGCFFFPDVVAGQPVVFRGGCNASIAVVQDFDPVAYMGIWHDIESYPSVFQTGDCRNANYELTNVVEVLNTQVINQTLDTMRGVAVLVSDDNSAKLEVTFPVADTDVSITTDYWVLSTDYKSYALVYTCLELPATEEKQVWAWKLSRTKELTQSASDSINEAMAQVPVLDQRYFVPVDQSPDGCFYFPEPQSGVPVVFPGQCDENIAVVQDFNLTQFQGTWIEIEAYPKEEVQGQCIRHQYSIGTGNVLNLQSTQIEDQFLQTTNGILSFANANDNSGRLVITLDGGIEIPFWILDTDYVDYALAYSCVNSGDDFRRVFSWKLSRTNVLSGSATTAIANVMSKIDVLGQQYFEHVDQSLDACFYLPDLEPGEPIILVGQCDPNITVAPNFVASSFLGRWRLIESYPSEFQNGECSDATYDLNSNGIIDVRNTEVIDTTLSVINGQATIIDDAKLLPLEYWILDTDYTSYALVYTCLNLDSETRRVWSWKMSRTRSLTPEANAAINQKINTINVLNNRYYEEISHSDEDCFYFPEPSQTPVQFRGQCDPNIQTYQGLWHTIEQYPSFNQEGTCGNAMYQLGEDGVIVFNTEVVNQTLSTITGLAVVASDDGSAKLDVVFPILGTNLTITTSYWVLDTDYDSYSLVYSCEQIDEEYRREATNNINNTISGIQVLDDRYYYEMDQSPDGCFYYPEPQPGVPVVFPGQCDETIDVVQNFNLTQFQGIWHEIEAYPKTEVQGQCVIHEYTENSQSSLNLQTSQVDGQSLITSSGTLSFTSNDNSAKMAININVNGQVINIPFWILSTDYIDYALAYSCVNIGVDTRAVYSWKLSRSQELSENANVQIDETMASVPVLRSDYYEKVDQSADACFYFPELGPNEAVTFRGQCDPNIKVVENFDGVAYMGLWRLIETYHSDFQSGECQEATYILNVDGTVDVINTQVVNENLLTVNGLATVIGDGKLLVNFPGAEEPTEYWIIDTDYTSYSLVYSCRNLDNQRRRVWSWKMSRGVELTDSDRENIDSAMEAIDVIDNRYFYEISHTPASCFYFPEPDSMTPVRFRGQCDLDIPAVSNFDVEKYLGLWHNIQLYPSEFQSGSCSNAYYSIGLEGVDVLNTQVINQTLDTIIGLAVLDSDDGSGKLKVTFPVADTSDTVSTSYWVLATDYISYSLVYTCIQLENSRLVYSWKLSRTKELSLEAEAAINNVTSAIQVLDERYYNTVDQSPSGCFYFPEHQPGVPVNFPGQCDDNINVVQNFSLDQFEGLWHEIEAYPKEQQQGQCINHQFSSGQTGSNTLNLQSTQVANLSLGVNNGVLSFASTDGSARMTITITVEGQEITIPYWILATDYTDYALAYSCVNLANERRAVYSWKLSKNRELSSAANDKINEIIDTIDVLGQQYYEKIDQTDDACFYLPELGPDDSVIFRGQCDENISGVQNFDASLYIGLWRSIETYQSDFQGGTCIQATYIPSDEGVIVYNTQVINQTLDTINGTAIVGSTDGSGLLLVDFPTSPELAKYYILATDYFSYSLVYSCRNINPEQRQVWAWKLSRERELSETANNIIDEVMESINVLDNRYFQNIPQDQAACFYYPEPNGKPVTFRGQCDESVAVVQNFNVEAYQGVWYDIESFPQNFQTGTCPTATYTLNDEGTVDVYNTQVVNQQLDEISAVAVLATDDGSAKLDVTFPIAGTDLTITTPYWVLATDYSNYSLVYSCEKITEDSYRVSSWKLSREKELSNDAISAMAEAQQNVKELLDIYYEERGHTEENCFFYPDNNGGPVILDGQCEDADDVDVVTDFDANSFSGTWYEIERFPSEIQNGECVANQFESNQNGFAINKTIIYNERLQTFTGQATLSPDNRGVLSISLSNGVDTINGNLFVLDTDYVDYALLYSCRNVNNEQKQVYSWKVSRNQNELSQNANVNIDAIVTDRRFLFQNYYEKTEQDSSACFYYPVFDGPQTSIKLPGLCNTSITGIPNFDAASYLGLWYEISSYPEPNQIGECARALYAPGNNVVDVTNTQVANRTLLSQTGSAVVASTDGSGLLTVTFVVNGETRTASYYILATDYASYSLVYNCRNLEDGRREVFSWKLSRTKTLSDSASAAIDTAIGSTQGLLEDYYEPTSQSDEDCFYVPEFVSDQTLRFRGRCDQFTGTFQNFESQKYLNKRWHEIARYPSDENGGNCVSTSYQTSGNTITFEGTRVFGINDGRVTSGTATMNANGQIQRTYADGSMEILWVLATDYDTYSLLLSCEDIDDEYMQVWSAKHSSTRSLSSEAENALAPVIDDNDLLYDEFFMDVDQSDSACFFYPTQDGQSVILPGQCDVNIQTEQDFDLTAYTGTWYQIERYPYPQVSADSTCIGTRYTQQSDNELDVLNWEINDGDLNTIPGVATLESANNATILKVVLQTDPDDEEATVTANVYVLKTDYVSYSLVYTCENIDEYHRTVVAIKLSRTRSLPSAAQNEINSFMATRDELHQPFFIQVTHNEECEDPSSSYLIKSSIIVTLLCLIIQTLI
ncbi:unnamed protein product [Diatraea saccharalis]|uniref:Lipocalin/cytosolic fatty-acid binding domain-containing protein n=1 Tax=Diatraea saccharalis TaxID=40085 RepID=A0A9N9WE93_9NEOP|nr:unnamed protein product [Diatraea saccharalis]